MWQSLCGLFSEADGNDLKLRSGSITGGLTIAQNIAQTLNKALPVGIVFKYIALFGAANDE